MAASLPSVGTLEALLPDDDGPAPPLTLMLALLRLGSGNVSGTLRSLIESKLSRVATTLPRDVRAQLAAEVSEYDLRRAFHALDGCQQAGFRPANRTSPETNAAVSLGSDEVRRLSECRQLWQRSRGYYTTSGVRAWVSGDVPYHISQSAFVASAHAAIIHTFLEEAARSPPSADDETTTLIVDLGCGCGLLGVRVARELYHRGERRFRVILADIDVDAALEQARMPAAAPLVAAGLLDVARLGGDGDGDDASGGFVPLELLLSGQRIESSPGRLVLLAHYVLDSMPIDLFRVSTSSDGAARERASPRGPAAKRLKPDQPRPPSAPTPSKCTHARCTRPLPLRQFS